MAQHIVTRETHGFGVSIDLDAFDPKLVPGVGSPEKDGLQPKPTFEALQSTLFSDPMLKAVEIVELNPSRDVDDKSSLVVFEILKSLGKANLECLEREMCKASLA